MTGRTHLARIRVVGRLLVLGCLLLALLPPPLPWTRAALDLIVLVDESLSMPREYSDSAWQQLGALLAEAPTNTRLRLARFGAGPVLENLARVAPANLPGAMPRARALDPTATDIARALQQALRMVQPERPAIMLLVSDTAATHGDTESALRAVNRAGVPLYLLAPQAGPSGAAPSLQALQVPARVITGERVQVVAAVKSAPGGTLALTLEIDGRVVDRQLLEPAPGEPTLASFHFVPTAAGVSLVSVRVTREPEAGRDGSSDAQTRAVNVVGPAPLLYLSRPGGANPVVDSLALAGWEIDSLSPADFALQLPLLPRAGAIILDDLAITELSEATWQTLVNAVRVDGKGLAVLGGPHSFGAGAYRHSSLEQILPVTAEAADPQAPAAVMFVLDRSGSMGREQAGPSRLSMARQAVATSVERLLPNDYLGIITFAAEAEIRLPLAARQAANGKVPAALDVDSSGGTRLAPALRLAAQQLRAVDVRQRLIVLVTDGFTSEADLQAIARELDAGGITVIALAVGSEPNREILQLLTGFNRGRVLAVTDATALPRLMSHAVATERAPTVAGVTVPVVAQAPPFLASPVSAWPPLAAYMVSKARPFAQVYLQSSRGDPLFATGRAGAGRVAVLPAGLGPWASAWWQWPEFGAILGSLAHWLERGHEADGLSMEVRDHPGELQFSVDLQADGEWDSGQRPRLLVDDPAGARTELTPALTAPGLYQATLPAHRPGLYRVTLQVGEHTLRHALYRNASDEMHTAPVHRSSWLEEGWLMPWPGVEGLLAAAPRDASGLRRVMLALALFSYLVLLALERGLAGPAARWLRARFSMSPATGPAATTRSRE